MAAITVVDANADINLVAANAGGDTVLSGTKAGDWVQNGVFVLVNNGSAGTRTVTIAGRAFSVPAGEFHALPANRGVYQGKAVAVTYDSATSVTVGAFRT